MLFVRFLLTDLVLGLSRDERFYVLLKKCVTDNKQQEINAK